MKNFTLAAFVLTAALRASAAPAPLAYEAAAAAAKVPVAPVQFAILHALLDWKGGSNPDYASYKEKDADYLKKTGISVRPIEKEVDRRILENRLADVRAARNNGAVTQKRKPISAERMAAEHRSLLVGYASRITVGTVGSDGGKPSGTTTAGVSLPTLGRQVARLRDALKALSTSTDQADFERNLAEFNAAAAVFPGKNYKVTRAEGESFASVVERARDIYAAESAAFSSYAVSKGYPATHDHAELESLKAAGAFFDGGNGEKIPVVAGGAFGSRQDPNKIAASFNKPALAGETKLPPAPKTEEKGGRKPGLFGLLGSLLGGLFRTLARVGTALFQGAVGVAKAVLS